MLAGMTGTKKMVKSEVRILKHVLIFPRQVALMLNFVMAFMFISQALCIIDIEITQDAFTA